MTVSRFKVGSDKKRKETIPTRYFIENDTKIAKAIVDA